MIARNSLELHTRFTTPCLKYHEDGAGVIWVPGNSACRVIALGSHKARLKRTFAHSQQWLWTEQCTPGAHKLSYMARGHSFVLSRKDGE